MTKQERIEEMAKHGCYDGCASGLRKFCDEYNGKPCKNMVRIAAGLNEQGYQKIVWRDAKKELPERNKYVLGYCSSDNTYAVVKWDCVDWSDNNEVCYNVDYWTELPEIKLE